MSLRVACVLSLCVVGCCVDINAHTHTHTPAQRRTTKLSKHAHARTRTRSTSRNELEFFGTWPRTHPQKRARQQVLEQLTLKHITNLLYFMKFNNCTGYFVCCLYRLLKRGSVQAKVSHDLGLSLSLSSLSVLLSSLSSRLLSLTLSVLPCSYFSSLSLSLSLRFSPSLLLPPPPSSSSTPVLRLLSLAVETHFLVPVIGISPQLLKNDGGGRPLACCSASLPLESSTRVLCAE